MDPITLRQKLQDIKIKTSMKSSKRQLGPDFLLCSLTAITCTLFCLIYSFWFSSIKLLFTTTALKITSLVSNTKVLFLISNLIVFFLIGESKFSSSNSSPDGNAYYSEYVKRRSNKVRAQKSVRKEAEIKETSIGLDEKEIAAQLANLGDDEDDHEGLMPAEELNKRANDMIARVNRQRRLEAKLFLCGRDV